jgi:hypothetical protein
LARPPTRSRGLRGVSLKPGPPRSVSMVWRMPSVGRVMRFLAYLATALCSSACGGLLGTDLRGDDAGMDASSTDSADSRADASARFDVGGRLPPPPPCLAHGASCQTSAECCTQQCDGGYCGSGPAPPLPTCQLDGVACGNASECCSGQCNNGTCGGNNGCVADGTACGDCLAAGCCAQLIACKQSAPCPASLTCYLACLADAGMGCGPICLSEFQSMAAVTLLIGCGGESCGSVCPSM